MSPEQEKYFQENFNDYDKSTKTDSFLNMFVLQPMMDNWANNGLAKSGSLHLEKALMTSNANINYLNKHALGSRFGVGILNKIPIVKNIFPDKTTKIWDNGVMGKLFKNTDFFYQTKFDKQVTEGTVNPTSKQYYQKGTVRHMYLDERPIQELKKNVDKANLQLDGEIVGHNISWSKKNVNDAVRKLKTLGITDADFSNNKMFLEIDGKRQLVDFNETNLKALINSKNTKASDFDKVGNSVHKLVNSIKGSADVKSTFKEEAYETLNNLLKEGAKDNKTVAGFVEANGDDVSKYSKKVYKKFMNLIDSVGLGGGSKQVMDGLKDSAIKVSATVTEEEAEQIAKTLTRKNVFEKFFSSSFGKVITQVGTGKLAFGLNIAGSIIGGIASHGQDTAIQNFAKTIVDYQLNSGKDVYESNEATMHSIQTHMQRSGDDLEEYKKQLYYRNFSNDMRRDMSRLDNEYLSADKIQTS